MISRVLHIITLIAVLFSATGIVFNKHYCQKELKEFALFFSPETCHSKANKKVKFCPKHAAKTQMACNETEDDGCCENESDYIESDINLLQAANPQIALDKPVIISAIVSLLVPDLHSRLFKPAPYEKYKPPLLFRDIILSQQSFLC